MFTSGVWIIVHSVDCFTPKIECHFTVIRTLIFSNDRIECFIRIFVSFMYRTRSKVNYCMFSYVDMGLKEKIMKLDRPKSPSRASRKHIGKIGPLPVRD